MSEPPESPDPESCARFLRDLGASDGRILPIAEAALVLASFERKRVDFARYRDHLRLIARDVATHPAASGDLAGRARALNEIILLKHGYCGDELTYDDLQNANLMRVIDRKKGLPVVLGILYIDTARAQGWEAAGLAFPGHFLLRLSEGAERLILDPFHNGQICGAAELRELLKAVAGEERELSPGFYAPVADRDVLLRLQNNLKSRLIQERRHERAANIVETMLMLAPDLAELWREAGLLHRQFGNMRAAAAAFEQYIVRAPEGAARHQAAAILQKLRAQLN
ncbi:MAG TPA: transglutaminase-like domain-containing protein [Stellaceae bacterium]|jgi:regulator of sirC expression with transglutaminase-like and TPR domain